MARAQQPRKAKGPRQVKGVRRTARAHTLQVKHVEHLVMGIGGAAVLITAVTGVALFLLALAISMRFATALQFLSGAWIAFGFGYFAGMALFEKGWHRAGGNILWILGVLGLFVAAGFFIGAILAIVAGHIGVHAHLRDKHLARQAVRRAATDRKLAAVWTLHHIKRRGRR